MEVSPVGLPPPEPGLAELAEPPELDEPTDAELLGLWPDPFAGPPEGADAWLGDLGLAELDARPMMSWWGCCAHARSASNAGGDDA